MMKKAVILCGGGIGDALVTLPLMRELHHRNVSFEVIVDNPGSKEILKIAQIPEGSISIITKKPKYKSNLSLARCLLCRRYDISYQNHVAHGGFKYLFWPFLAKISERVGAEYRKNWKNRMLTKTYQREVKGQRSHRTVWNMRCITEEVKEEQYNYQIEHLVEIPKSVNRIGVHPGSDNLRASSLDRRWPAEKFASLCRSMKAKNKNLEILVFLGPKELNLEHFFSRSGAETVKDLSLAEATKKIATCRNFISNDSGLAHIACSCGIRPFVIFGPTSLDWRHHCPLRCNPVLAPNGRINSISVQDVLQNVISILDKG